MSADVQFSSQNQVNSKKKKVITSAPKKLQGHMECVPEKRARVLSSARVPGLPISSLGHLSSGHASGTF